jgi:hypothetical protein
MNFLRLITERMRSVNSHFITEIMRSERLSLVGSMANSIIHDLKNPICIVRCCSDLIASETNDPRLRELTSMLDGAVDGMLAMTQELLDYARGSTQLNKQLISVWGMLDELNQQSLRLLPGKNIHFVKHIRYDGNLEIDRARFVRMPFESDKKLARSDGRRWNSHHHYRSRARSGCAAHFRYRSWHSARDIAQAFRTIHDARKIERHRSWPRHWPDRWWKRMAEKFRFPVSTAAAPRSTFACPNRGNSTASQI